MQHTLTFVNDGIITGKVYRFRFQAINVKGSSDYSEQVSIAVSKPPLQASQPIVSYQLSTRTSIFVTWTLNQHGAGVGGAI
jgi:hypothetical protein